jgi:hypothetical protein
VVGQGGQGQACGCGPDAGAVGSMGGGGPGPLLTHPGRRSPQRGPCWRRWHARSRCPSPR